MDDRYADMTTSQLIDEMDAWQSVVDAPKAPGYASNAAREEAGRQLALAEAWYHRKSAK